jgi:glycosyltransferase involved in cell wall biosynthesis
VSKIRLMYLNPSLTQGGAERHVVDVVANLDDARFDVAMCVVRPGVHYQKDLPAGEPRFLLNRFFFSPLAFLGVVAAIRKFKPDVLHSHLNDGNLMARLAVRFAAVPVVVTSVHLDDLNWMYRLLERRLWPATSRIVAVSRGVRDFLVDRVRVPSERVQIVVNGVDPARFVPGSDEQRLAARRQFNIPETAQAALMPARISVQKNQDLVIETLGALKKSGALPGNFLLLLAGRTSSGRFMRKVQRLIARHGLHDQVRLLGTVKEMQALYWASDLVFMPSKSEGSSIAAFEAMSAGLPVLISDRGNTDGVIIEGQTGWQVPANDLPALASAVRQILQMPPAERRRLGAAGRRRIEERYTLKRVAHDLQTLYESLLASATAAAARNQDAA